MARAESGYERYQTERVWLWALTGLLMAIVIRGYYLTIRYLPASFRRARAMRDGASEGNYAEPPAPRRREKDI